MQASLQRNGRAGVPEAGVTIRNKYPYVNVSTSSPTSSLKDGGVKDIQVDAPNTSSAPDGSYSNQSRIGTTPLRIRIDRDLPDLPTSSQPNQGASHLESAAPTSPTDTLCQSQQDLQGTACETLLPSHLQLHQFGSRFLPHTTSPIRCILPINRDRLLLIGTDHGLSVLDMYPMEWASDGNTGIIQNGPGDAQARVVWTGEAYVIFE